MADFNRGERTGNPGRERFDGPCGRDRESRRPRGDYPDGDRHGSHRNLSRSGHTA